MSKYTWIVTKDEIAGDISDAIGKIGPPGPSARFRFDRVISGGAEFRLLNGAGEPKFCGFILGDYHGGEPLAEYGRDFGCAFIEYRSNGRWVRFEGSLPATNTGISYFSRTG